MKENTVYLLYNTNAKNIKLEHGLVANYNREIGSREWEYEDKDEFTILYSPDDERKYTDIKILSKTKLKERPKSADQLTMKAKVSVEGVLIRRSNSLSIIEEDLLLLRRCPQIKPLLSETEIQQLQLLLQECRRNKQVMGKTESNMSNVFQQLFPDDHNVRKTTGYLNGVAFESSKGKRNLSLSPQELDANKAREKANILSHYDNTGEQNTLDRWNKTPILNLGKFKNGESKSNLFGTTKKVKPKKQDLVGARSKLEDRTNNDKSKRSKTVTNEDAMRNRKKPSRTRSTSEQNTSKKKGKSNHGVEPKDKENVKHKKHSVQTKKEIDEPTSKRKLSRQDYSSDKTPLSKQQKTKIKSKDIDGKTKSEENVSDQGQFNHSSQKRPFLKQKGSRNKRKEIGKISNSKENFPNQDKFGQSSEKTSLSSQQGSKKKSIDNIKSLNNKTKLKKNKDSEIALSTEKTEKSKRSGKTKPVVVSDTLKIDEKSPKSSSILLSSRTFLKKGKTNQGKNKTLDDICLPEDMLTKKESGKFTLPKSSPSDKTKKTKKTEDTADTGTENTSAKKGKTKDKMLPGTIQYIIHYILSNPVYIDLGWTLQPIKKAFSRIVTFKTMPANPQSYCFRNRGNAEEKFYPSGALALNIAEDGTGRVNYPGGAPAIILTRSPVGMKLTLYSCPTNDPLVKESFYTRIIGMFDSFGYGVVYNSNGKKILNFNQMEGIHYSPSKTTPYKWQWSCFKVLEAKRLKELLNAMVNEAKQPVPTTKGAKVLKAPISGSSRKSITPQEKKPVDKIYEALLEELPYPVMPKQKLKTKTNDNALKSIILKINKEITLRINGQDSVTVNFSAKTLFYKMDLGVKIDPENVERVDEVADNRAESIVSVLGDLLYPSPSLKKLHQLLDPSTLH